MLKMILRLVELSSPKSHRNSIAEQTANISGYKMNAKLELTEILTSEK